MSAAIQAQLELRNRQMMKKLLVIVVGMLGFCAAMVPLYRQICEAIGITQQRAVATNVNTQVDRSRMVHVELLAEGLPNKAIAVRLGISDQTVKFHVASICGKLGAANRTDAVRRAVRRGLISL